MPAKAEEPSDSELCERARAGDKDAVSAMVKRHYGLAVAACRRFRIADNIDLDDLIQEALMAITRSVVMFDPAQGIKFCTYAMRAAHNRIHHYLHTPRFMPIQARSITEEDRSTDRQPPPDVKELLAELAYVPRRVVEMYYGVYGKAVGIQKIGDVLGLSWPQVRTILDESLDYLRLSAGKVAP